jgi:hypothetical protein
LADLTSIRIDESSGPVSPRFHYAVQATITRNADGTGSAAFLHRTKERTVEATRDVSTARLAALTSFLDQHLPEGPDRDLVGARRDRKGASYNHLVLRRGGTDMRVDYMLSDLDDPAHADVGAAVEAVKALVEELATTKE